MDLMLDSKSLRNYDKCHQGESDLGSATAGRITSYVASRWKHTVCHGLGSGWCILFQSICLCETQLPILPNWQVVSVVDLQRFVGWNPVTTPQRVSKSAHFHKWFHMISPQIIEHHLDLVIAGLIFCTMPNLPRLVGGYWCPTHRRGAKKIAEDPQDTL